MKNVLLCRLFIINAVILAWFGITDVKYGWLTALILSDTSRIATLIVAWFFVAHVYMFFDAKEINAVYNRLKDKFTGERVRVSQYRLRKIEWYEWAAGAMFVLGLIGTLIGLGISLAKVNPGSLNNLEGMKEIAIQMLVGLRTELSATIIGAIFGLWTEMNYQMTRVFALHVEEMNE